MKFSVLMINFNGQDTIERAVDSALGQTYEDIEVICVDDCSTDNSIEILKKYENEPRFRLVRHEKNSGMTCGRVSGIEAATGDRCVFLDGDDELVPDCCKILAETAQKHDCDIIGYGADIKFTVNVSNDTMSGMRNSFAQLEGLLEGDEILEAIYVKKTIKETLWSKCYKTSFLKNALKYIKKDYINLCEDYYFTFVTSRLAETYYGIEDRLLYYYVGSGVSTTVQAVAPASIERNINSVVNSFTNCKKFIEEFGATDKYRTHVFKHERELIFVFLNKIKFLASEEDKERITKIIIEKFGIKQLVCSMAENYWDNINGIMRTMDMKRWFPETKKPIKTVALYHLKLDGGETETVVSRMSYLLAEQGYNVVVITDREKDANDLDIAESAVRVSLGEEYPVEDGETYVDRYDKLAECIEKYSIDAFIDCFDHSVFGAWDMLAVKSLGVSFIVYVQNTFVTDLFEGFAELLEKQEAYAFADGIVTMTEADRIFWLRSNKNTFLLDRPRSKIENVSVEKKNSKRILWVGDVDSFDNNPMDPIYILYRIVQSIPEAEVTICGEVSEPVKNLLLDIALNLNVTEKITFTGKVADAGPYYRDASVVLITYNSIGSSSVIYDSLSYGVPVVAYEVPGSTYAKQSKAVVSIPYRSYDDATKHINNILGNDELREELSGEALKASADWDEKELGAAWKNVISFIESGAVQEMPETFAADAVHELSNLANLAFTQTNIRIKAFEKDLYNTRVDCEKLRLELLAKDEKIMREYNELSDRMSEIYKSKTYKFGQFITFIPRKVRGVNWLLKHRGFKYTFLHMMGKTPDIEGESEE